MKFWTDPEITKVGHTLNGDRLEMTRSLKIDFGKDGLKGTVDLCEEMRRADGNMVGLAKMCSDFLGKEMCKYNTRSNWGQSE